MRPKGLRAARSHQQVDVAIVDRGLPDRDGLEVVAELRTQLPSLPVIVASGYSDLPEHAALRNDPHIRFMSKPYDIDGAHDSAARPARAHQRDGLELLSGMTAVASISTFAPGSSNPRRLTTDIGG